MVSSTSLAVGASFVTSLDCFAAATDTVARPRLQQPTLASCAAYARPIPIGRLATCTSCNSHGPSAQRKDAARAAQTSHVLGPGGPCLMARSRRSLREAQTGLSGDARSRGTVPGSHFALFMTLTWARHDANVHLFSMAQDHSSWNIAARGGLRLQRQREAKTSSFKLQHSINNIRCKIPNCFLGTL